MNSIKQSFTRHMVRLAFSLAISLIISIPILAKAEVNPEIANCEEIKDEDTQFQAELCSAHLGCKMVLKVQNTCAKAKKFLTNLKESIDDGAKALFNSRKEITPDAIFEANIPDKTRILDTHPETQDLVTRMRASLRKQGNKGEVTTGGKVSLNYVHYGEMNNGIANGLGTRIFSNGVMLRGSFKANQVNGQADVVFTENGTREVGEYEDKYLKKGVRASGSGELISGQFVKDALVEGKLIRPNGTRFEGRFNNNIPIEGKEFRSDGSLAMDGTFDTKGYMIVGKQYDQSGASTPEVNKPRTGSSSLNKNKNKNKSNSKTEDGNLYVIKENWPYVDQRGQSARAEWHYLVAARSAEEAINSLKTFNRYPHNQNYTLVNECKGRGWGAIWTVQDDVSNNWKQQVGWSCGAKSAKSALLVAWEACVERGSMECQDREGISVSTGRGGPLVTPPTWHDEPWGGVTQAHEWGYVDTSKLGGGFIPKADDLISKLNDISSTSNYPNYFTYSNFNCIYTSDFKEKMTQCLDKKYGK